MSYAHTQQGGLHWLLWFTAVICLMGTWYAFLDDETFAVGILAGVAALTAALALCFMSLTVHDGGDALEVNFGPIPLFSRRIPYAAISDPTPSRSKLIDGFGVHWFPGRGWTWNLWGFDCVDMRVDGKPLRIGTDDAEALANYLNMRILRLRAA